MTPKTYGLIGLVILALVLTAGIVGGVTYLNKKWYNDGYSAAEKTYKLAIAEEKARQESILRRIENIHREDIVELETKNDLLEQALKRNEEEAKNDPFRDRPALSKSAVMRLNKIR
jgi:uncharacterized membrane protein